MKKILAVLTALLVLIIILVLLSPRGLIGDDATVTVFTNDGEPTGVALIRIPFLKDVPERLPVSIWADVNTDGTFSEDEKLISAVPTALQKKWHNGYYASVAATFGEEIRLRVRAGESEKDVAAPVDSYEVGTLLDLGTVTNAEEAMKGFALPIAHAQGTESADVFTNDVPDLTQRPSECAPTAAANNLIALVDRFGGEDLISGDPEDFIENLKRHMDWTPENGVLPDAFVAGKNQWAAAAGVPIRTTKVGDRNGTSTVDALREALQKGSAVELRITFANDQRRAVGGHMVTVVGVHEIDGKIHLDINDPVTPYEGTETVELESNRIVNYGPWQGLSVLSWGFVQTWEGHPTGELLDPMTDAEIQGIKEFVGDRETIKVISYQGHHLPVSKLRVGKAHPPHEYGEGCPEEHWHADEPVESLEGDVFSDPNAGGCGFGTVRQRPSENYTLPKIPIGGNAEVRGLEELRSQ